jgi:hypothetical protein
MKKLGILLILSLVLCVANVSYAVNIWGVQVGSASNTLINIDPFTGVVSNTFTAPNFTPGNTDIGLAGYQNALFYTNADSENGKIYSISPVTGATVGSYTVSGGWEIDGLGYWSGSGNSYIFSSGCSVNDVHRYNAADGASPSFYWSDISNPLSMAGDNGGKIFTVGNNAAGQFGIWQMDPLSDVAGTFFGSSPSSSIVGMAYDGTYLYLSDLQNMLYTMDNSGNLVNSLSLGYTLYALGSSEGAPVPEPSTLLLLGFGLAGIGLLRKRKS